MTPGRSTHGEPTFRCSMISAVTLVPAPCCHPSSTVHRWRQRASRSGASSLNPSETCPSNSDRILRTGLLRALLSDPFLSPTKRTWLPTLLASSCFHHLSTIHTLPFDPVSEYATCYMIHDTTKGPIVGQPSFVSPHTPSAQVPLRQSAQATRVYMH